MALGFAVVYVVYITAKISGILDKVKKIKDPRRAATCTGMLKLLTLTALSNIPAATVTKNSRTDIDLTVTPLISTGFPKLKMQTRKGKSK